MKPVLFAAAATVAELALSVVLCAPAQLWAQQPASIDFAVEAQPLGSALADFSRQADMTVTASGRLTEGRRSPGFSGSASPMLAMAALLEGTGLQAQLKDGALIIVPAAAEAPAVADGRLQGTVLRADNRVPLRNVRVGIAGTALSTTTDRFGSFELQAPAGRYALQLEHPDYRGQRLADVELKAGLSLQLELLLEPLSSAAPDDAAVELDSLVVTGKYVETSVATERYAAGIVDSVDFDQIARFDDSTVGTALTRIVGVSLEEGRYAVVRGMKSRYQSVYFNDAVLPSTDPGRRDLAMDIFPASIMQALTLQKTASPDVPGTATAGHIDMRTREVPDAPFAKISGSVVFWDDVDNEVLRAEGGDSDWLGYDDGSRELPAALQAIAGTYYNSGDAAYNIYSPEQIEAAGESIRHGDITIGDANQDVSLDFSGGRGWTLDNGQQLGLIGALRYANKWTNRDLYNYGFNVRQDTGELVLSEYTRTWDSNNIIDLSAMLNLLWEPAKGHSLGWNNMLLRHTLDSVEQEYACEYCFDANADYVYYPSSDYAYTYDIDWIEEQLWGSQLYGHHRFDGLGGLSLDWLWLGATAEFDRPGAARYTWSANQIDVSPALLLGSDTQRNEWEDMQEDSSSARVDLSLPLFAASSVPTQLSVGGYLLGRERNGAEYGWYYFGGGDEITQQELESRQPGDFFTAENICGGQGCNGVQLYIADFSPDRDVGLAGRNYVVEQNTDAYYAKTEFDFWGRAQATLGLRYEAFTIAAEMFEYSREPLVTLLDEAFYLPSAALTLPFREQWQLRMAYGRTVSWPEVFEILPRNFKDFDTSEVYQGNPELKPARIDNYDLRLEWYPDADESASLALFYKDLKDPIENTFLGENEEYSSYTFDNVPSAMVYGWEFDLRQVFALAAGHELFVLFNYADIDSEVELPPDTLEYDPDRPLQGQPDYLLNLSLGYDHLPSNQQFTVAYSRRGEELAVVTNNEGIALDNNVYEQPYDDLKLIYSKGFNSGFSVQLSVENALGSDRHLEYEQVGVPYLQYDIGTRAKIKLGYRF